MLDSNYFSIYKGKPVIRTNGERSGSFGVLFIKRTWSENPSQSCKMQEVAHEYGHTVQLKQLGIIDYLLYIGILSALRLGSGRYYNQPWEITADYYGGVVRVEHTDEYMDNGFAYLEMIEQLDYKMSFAMIGV